MVVVTGLKWRITRRGKEDRFYSKKNAVKKGKQWRSKGYKNVRLYKGTPKGWIKIRL